MKKVKAAFLRSIGLRKQQKGPYHWIMYHNV